MAVPGSALSPVRAWETPITMGWSHGAIGQAAEGAADGATDAAAADAAADAAATDGAGVEVAAPAQPARATAPAATSAMRVRTPGWAIDRLGRSTLTALGPRFLSRVLGGNRLPLVRKSIAQWAEYPGGEMPCQYPNGRVPETAARREAGRAWRIDCEFGLPGHRPGRYTPRHGAGRPEGGRAGTERGPATPCPCWCATRGSIPREGCDPSPSTFSWRATASPPSGRAVRRPRPAPRSSPPVAPWSPRRWSTPTYAWTLPSPWANRGTTSRGRSSRAS